MPEQQAEFDFYITPDGETFNLHDMHVRWIMGGIGGRGMPPIQYHSIRGPYQHGETVEDYRLRPRVMQLIFRQQGYQRQEYWDIRQAFLDALRPNRSLAGDPGQLRKIFPDESIRDIDVYTLEGPGFPQDDPNQWDAWAAGDLVRFVAPNPTFYDPTERLFNAVMAIELELVFPIDPFILFGPMTNAFIASNVTLNGTWASWPVIEFVGPMTSPVIYNATIDETITLDLEILGGRTVTMDLLPRRKTVVDDLGNNLLAYVKEDSDLVTWRLEVDPIAPLGVNDVQLSAGGLDLATSQLNIRWYDRWIGI